MRNFFLILIYSPHVYENSLEFSIVNSILNVIFAKLIKDEIKEIDFPKHELQCQLKYTNYGILVSK